MLGDKNKIEINSKNACNHSKCKWARLRFLFFFFKCQTGLNACVETSWEAKSYQQMKEERCFHIIFWVIGNNYKTSPFETIKLV